MLEHNNLLDSSNENQQPWNIFHRKRPSMEIPIYFSQSLIIISKIISKHSSDSVSCANDLICDNQLELISDANSYYDKYIFYPYNFTCWYLTSYKMILQNRIYHISYSCRKMLIKTCVNLINKLTFLCRTLTMINFNN